ncbi:MAG: PH domain-containing protein [Myxococcaceae bacterium]|nr:PH domain-containing protein [Myxococcaceae bacterium]
MTPFFPYHPKRARWSLVGAAVVAVGLTAWALAAATQGEGPLAFARAGIAAGLGLTALVLHHRLRPREGWGVRLLPEGLVVSRPFDGVVEIPWEEVTALDEEGRALAVRLRDGGRVLVPRFLFEGPAEVDALARALKERSPA